MANVFSDRKRKLDILSAMRPGKTTRPGAEQTPYVKCQSCMADHARATLEQSLYLCPRCGCHLRWPARERLLTMLDAGSFREKFRGVKSKNPIDFPGYEAKLRSITEQTGLAEACICSAGSIGGVRVMAAALDASFMMGSMGTAVGEKITRSAEYARVNHMPLIIFSASGGARMQEGIFSLMQMAKTAAAIRRLSDEGGLYISCITHPTTGGVTASFASLGDIILAEPGALFGFAGPRVIEQTIGDRLPDGFQRSEFQLEHGFVDAIVPRGELKKTLSVLLNLHRR